MTFSRVCYSVLPCSVSGPSVFLDLKIFRSSPPSGMRPEAPESGLETERLRVNHTRHLVVTRSRGLVQTSVVRASVLVRTRALRGRRLRTQEERKEERMEVPTLKKGEAHRGPGVAREREVPIPQDRCPRQPKM